MEQEVRNILANFAMDRKAALDRIEASWKGHKRVINRQEAENWVGGFGTGDRKTLAC